MKQWLRELFCYHKWIDWPPNGYGYVHCRKCHKTINCM